MTCLYTQAALNSTWAIVLPLVSMVTFLIHTQILGKPLTPALGFTALTLFNILRYPLTDVPSQFNGLSRAMTSLSRIEKFLSSAEVHGLHMINTGDVVVDARCAVVGWSYPAPDYLEDIHQDCSCIGLELSLRQLEDIETGFNRQPDYYVVFSNLDVSISKNSLVVVAGTTGTGKSTFVSGLLGECKVFSGCIHVKSRKVSYVPQSAFIQSGTLRENILFGSQFEEERYNTVVWCCGLDKDIAHLPHGDLTQIGEKGVNLSVSREFIIFLYTVIFFI